MKINYQFRVFTLLDTLTFGLATLFSCIVMVGVLATPGNPVIGQLITAATTAGFAFVYCMILWRRALFKKSIAFITNHGLVVRKSTFPVIRAQLEGLTEKVAYQWVEALKQEQVSSRLAGEIIWGALKGLVVEWREAPWMMHIRPGFKWMGLTKASGNGIIVGFLPVLTNTAFAHELGHVFMIAWKGDGSEDGLKQMSERYGLPA